MAVEATAHSRVPTMRERIDGVVAGACAETILSAGIVASESILANINDETWIKMARLCANQNLAIYRSDLQRFVGLVLHL